MGALLHSETGRVLAPTAYLARGFWAQFWGLMGRKAAGGGIALGLPLCRRVHTAFVRGALDVVFCDRGGRAILVVANLAPWRVSPKAPAQTAWAWEAQAGRLAPFVALGDELRHEDEAAA